jgi:hypothetical protein
MPPHDNPATETFAQVSLEPRHGGSSENFAPAISQANPLPFFYVCCQFTSYLLMLYIMKNKMKSISVAMLMLALASVVIARATNVQMAIQNQSQYFTGTTEMTQQVGNPVYTNVSGQGTFPLTTTSNPTGFILNGYVTAPGTVGYAYIRYANFGVKLTVDFTSSNIAVTDQQIVQ